MSKQVVKMRLVRRIVIRPALLSLFIGLGVGCTVTRDEVVGTYTLQYDFGTEELLLGPDGTYDQSFEKRGASTLNPNTPDDGPLVMDHPVRWPTAWRT
jgi:hypothetical protein